MDTEKVCKMFIEEPSRKKVCGGGVLRSTWEGNMKLVLKDIRCTSVDGVQVSEIVNCQEPSGCVNGISLSPEQLYTTVLNEDVPLNRF
jgi:hypothetical protein